MTQFEPDYSEIVTKRLALPSKDNHRKASSFELPLIKTPILIRKYTRVCGSHRDWLKVTW